MLLPRILPRLLRLHALQGASHFSTTAVLGSARTPPPFQQSPSPPRLPKEDQATFERLTKASLGAFSAPVAETADEPLTEAEILELQSTQHADARRGGEKPLFEGDTNPMTGEVGGPKTEPTKYGDWSFNGRVTDF